MNKSLYLVRLGDFDFSNWDRFCSQMIRSLDNFVDKESIYVRILEDTENLIEQEMNNFITLRKIKGGIYRLEVFNSIYQHILGGPINNEYARPEDFCLFTKPPSAILFPNNYEYLNKVEDIKKIFVHEKGEFERAINKELFLRKYNKEIENI